MQAIEQVLIRFPAAGEVIQFSPVEPWILWYRVHSLGPLECPCVLDHCPFCANDSGFTRACYQGFLAGFAGDRGAVPLVLRLTPQVFRAWQQKGGMPPDLRQWTLTVTRERTAGRPKLGLLGVRDRVAGRTEWKGVSSVPTYLFRFWQLPHNDPDFRQRVYALPPRLAPHSDSPPCPHIWPGVLGEQEP